jgi:hypothetical protein
MDIDMKRTWFQVSTWLLWLALPLTALRYWMAWDQLPARMATHFDASGHPNGWMPRDTSLWFALGLTALMLVIFTLVPYLAARKRGTSAAFCWACVAFAWVIVGFVFYVNNSLVEYNLTGLFLASGRGPSLTSGTRVAEETHASRMWALVFLIPAGAELWVLARIHVPGAQVGLGLTCLLFVLIAVQAWTGFQYRFTSAGVEIRTLGFRLQSIPLAAIRHYSIAKWNALRGYGIRGLGGRRAYVWGNRVVHIATDHGDVFLGHNDPARLVRDLDAIKGFAHL